MNKELDILMSEYNSCIAYRLKCNATWSKKNYTSNDFDKEGLIVSKISKLKSK